MMTRLITILTIVLFTLAVAGCSKEDDSDVKKITEEKTQEENGAMPVEKEESSEKNSFASIQKVGDVYMLVDQMYQLHVDSPSFEYVPRGVHVLVANPTDQAQDLQFLKEVDHTYAVGEEQKHMVMETGIFGEKFPDQLEAGAVMSTYYVFYWPQFEAHDEGVLTFTADGTASRFLLSGVLEEKLYSDVRTHIYQFASKQTVEQPVFHERTETLKIADCSQFSAKVATCSFVEQSHEMTGFILQDGTTYSYPHGRSAGKMSTSLDGEVLTFYFDYSGLLRVETADGRQVNVTAEMLLIFAKIEEQAKFMLEEVERDATTVSPENRMTADEANQHIIDVIRPASQAIEHAINRDEITGEINGRSTVYQLDNIKKMVKNFGDHTMSVTFIDDALAFVLRVDPATKQLLRYYFAKDQLIRILTEAGDMIHFENAEDQEHFLKTEQALLAEYSL